MSGPPPGKRNHGGMNNLPPNSAMHPSTTNLSFNVPFASNLAGLEPEEIIYASPGAFNRWTHPPETPEGAAIHELPVHKRDVERLRVLCKTMCDTSGGTIEAAVTSAKPKPVPGMQRGPLTALVTNVAISGDTEVVKQMRAKILNETPITLRSSSVEVSPRILMGPDSTDVRADVLKHMDEIADKTKADIFLLHPKQSDETASLHGNLELSTEGKLRVVIYGDMESCDHAKTRLLIMIDQILGRVVDTIKLELTLHNLICGRYRRNIKLIESSTNTAIYFPPLFPTVFGFSPAGAFPRSRDEIIITGENQDNILQAKKRLYDLVQATKTFVKDVAVTTTKIDSILLERLDKIKRIIEQNGSYVLLPPLSSQSSILRVQATDILNVERTVREIMSLAGQFYSATWWLTGMEASQRQPAPVQIREMLADICINSGAEITFDKLNFNIWGSDDAVKAAMTIINSLPFVKKASSTLRVKVELANEHKEFVSGKKNGKINKIMSQSNVQIVFDGFNEYNFYIDVRGSSYDATKNGLELVELEMPASIAFHVPDQYHKRIIGIGGQHIQRIMKKYSVFVKFSNAMDRGVHGKDEDDVKIDNVICRTPARNANNLEQVKDEIMAMVATEDAENTHEKVQVDRLYHRELMTHMSEIEELEKKWNCKVTFPGTEEASDSITVSGPEHQVPQAIDELLGMVPESHEIAFPSSPALREYLTSTDFREDTWQKLREQYVVEVIVCQPKPEPIANQPAQTRVLEILHLTYTRNNAGGLKDAIDFLTVKLVAHGLDSSTIRGAIPRPKSDSFEDSMPYFDSKLLQRAEPPLSTESPTRAQFDDNEPRSLFDKLRKPGSISSFSSFLDRRKNNGASTPGSLFKHASSNASKASLVSMESRESGYRNPWNDSGIDLDHDQINPHNSWGSFNTGGSRPATSSASLTTYEGKSKFPFGAGNASSTSLNTPIIPGLGGDVTPKYDAAADGHAKSATPTVPTANLTGLNGASRPTSSSTSTAPANSGYPAPIGPPR
ncbi:KH domain-containing protein 2 [Elsinoe fawcettii]|nr:KH domain-containing protein 2 [Elsinoe fawcettii]